MLLQDLNPLPMALMTAATLACTVYACVISDIFLFCTNLPGLLMAVFYTAACTPYASHKVRGPCESAGRQAVRDLQLNLAQQRLMAQHGMPLL